MSRAANSKIVFDEAGERLYGFDAELYLKMEAKRDRAWEKGVLEWVEQVLDEELADTSDVWLSFKSGVCLCRLVNEIKPGTIRKYAKKRLIPLIEMDNIQLYLTACWNLGIPSSDLFTIADLYKRKNLPNVVQSISSLATLAPGLGYDGALLQAVKNTNIVAAKKWDPVETAPKLVHTDELGDELEQENTALYIEIADLKAALMKIKGEKASLKQEMNAARRQEKEKKNKRKQSRVAAAPSEDLQKEVKQLEAALAESKKIAKDATGKASSLRAELKDVLHQSKATEAELLKAQEGEAFKAQILHLQTSLDAERKAAAERKVKRNAKASPLKATKVQMNAALKKSNKEISELKEANKKLQRKYDTQTKQMQTLKTRSPKLSKRSPSPASRRPASPSAGAAKQIADLKARLQEAESRSTRHGDVNKEVDLVQTELRKTRRALEDTQRLLEEATQRADEGQILLDGLRQDNELLMTDAETLTDDVMAAETALETVAQAKLTLEEERESERDAWEQEMEALRIWGDNAMQKTVEARQDLEKQVQDLRQRGQTEQEIRRGVEERLDVCEEEAAALRLAALEMKRAHTAELAELQSSRQHATADIEEELCDAHRRITKLQAQISTLKTRVSSLETENRALNVIFSNSDRLTQVRNLQQKRATVGGMSPAQRRKRFQSTIPSAEVERLLAGEEVKTAARRPLTSRAKNAKTISFALQPSRSSPDMNDASLELVGAPSRPMKSSMKTNTGVSNSQRATLNFDLPAEPVPAERHGSGTMVLAMSPGLQPRALNRAPAASPPQHARHSSGHKEIILEYDSSDEEALEDIDPTRRRASRATLDDVNDDANDNDKNDDKQGSPTSTADAGKRKKSVAIPGGGRALNRRRATTMVATGFFVGDGVDEEVVAKANAQLVMVLQNDEVDWDDIRDLEPFFKEDAGRRAFAFLISQQIECNLKLGSQYSLSVFKRLIKYVRNRGLGEPNLFREPDSGKKGKGKLVGGMLKKVNFKAASNKSAKLLDRINNNQGLILPLSGFGAKTVSSSLVLLLEQEEALFTFDFYDAFIELYTLTDGPRRLMEIRSLVKLLPHENQVLLGRVFGLLLDIWNHRAKTGWDDKGLAEVFGPLLLRPETATSQTREQLSYRIAFVRLLIQNSHAVFDLPCLDLCDRNFEQLLFLVKLALGKMNQDVQAQETLTMTMLMDVCRTVIRRVGDDMESMRGFVKDYFASQPTSYWEEYFSRRLIVAFMDRFPANEDDDDTPDPAARATEQTWICHTLQFYLVDMSHWTEVAQVRGVAEALQDGQDLQEDHTRQLGALMDVLETSASAKATSFKHNVRVRQSVSGRTQRSDKCYYCSVAFSLLQRRHHCRSCGQKVCGACSANKTNVDQALVRVCDICYSTVKNVVTSRPSSPRAV